MSRELIDAVARLLDAAEEEAAETMVMDGRTMVRAVEISRDEWCDYHGYDEED